MKRRTTTIIITSMVLCESSSAAVVMFDNSAAQFVWIANAGNSTPSGRFDPTLGPQEQTLFTPAWSLGYAAAIGGGSSTVLAEGFVPAGTQVHIAIRSEPSLVVGPNPGQETVFSQVARAFQPGQLVGSTSVFNAGAETGAFNISLGQINFLGQHPFVGFRVILADGLPR